MTKNSESTVAEIVTKDGDDDQFKEEREARQRSKVADGAKDLFDSEEVKPKRRRRTTKKKIEPPPIEVKELQKTIFDDILAARLGEHWKLSPKEHDALAAPTNAMIQKYFPVYAKWAVEINFGLAILTIVVPRVRYDLMRRKVAKQNNSDIRPQGVGEKLSGQQAQQGA